MDTTMTGFADRLDERWVEICLGMVFEVLLRTADHALAGGGQGSTVLEPLGPLPASDALLMREAVVDT
ncbi:MAG: hypothetical protein GYB36_12490 [Alphaproteobacteria bacterium]|nr:hypothetical protein [Alphaproteobacteria bacterium]